MEGPSPGRDLTYYRIPLWSAVPLVVVVYTQAYALQILYTRIRKAEYGYNTLGILRDTRQGSLPVVVKRVKNGFPPRTQ